MTDKINYIYCSSDRKKVEVLLQQMFQAEIAADDIGPEQLTENTEVSTLPRKLTFESIW